MNRIYQPDLEALPEGGALPPARDRIRWDFDRALVPRPRS
eukprot:CAMPEP_0173450664 /NCGR_PEP_ID=MMETSP1357-20121228/45221_1 /TAXON_ID=77926 /ORGANISM="Hemiselmis rufescens, Strain PCC563" /LENGTH=39 /DNA_ID= /DNA_START= /DNA_END= /DNA_ORIENTATION=